MTYSTTTELYAAAAIHAGIVDAVQSKAPEAPQLVSTKASPPVSQPKSVAPSTAPAQAKAAIEEVQKGADQTVKVSTGH